jgi:hypothetical protein
MPGAPRAISRRSRLTALSDEMAIAVLPGRHSDISGMALPHSASLSSSRFLAGSLRLCPRLGNWLRQAGATRI